MSTSAPFRTILPPWCSATRRSRTSRSPTRRKSRSRRRRTSTRRPRPPSERARARSQMKALRAVLLALLLGWVFPALALVAVPQLTGRVVDQTGTLSSGDIAQLTQTLADLQTRRGSEIAVLIVPTTDGEAIEQFSLRVAEAWKIGRKKVDDGALLVVAKNDRRLRIEVGYGLEGALTDVTTKRIIDEDITPKFKGGDFAGGISAGVGRMIGLV